MNVSLTAVRSFTSSGPLHSHLLLGTHERDSVQCARKNYREAHSLDPGMKLAVWVGISAEAKMPWMPYCLSATADWLLPPTPFSTIVLFTIAEPADCDFQKDGYRAYESSDLPQGQGHCPLPKDDLHWAEKSFKVQHIWWKKERSTSGNEHSDLLLCPQWTQNHHLTRTSHAQRLKVKKAFAWKILEEEITYPWLWAGLCGLCKGSGVSAGGADLTA